MIEIHRGFLAMPSSYRQDAAYSLPLRAYGFCDGKVQWGLKLTVPYAEDIY
jgi:hypothetical protein